MLKGYQILMINHYGLLLLILLITVGCKKDGKDMRNTNEIIKKYNLTFGDGYDLQNTNWKRSGKIYGNKKTDSCLIVLINKKGDTILTHLDIGIESWYPAKMIKTALEYFVIKREYTPVELDSTKTDYKSLSEAKGDYSYNAIDYPMDSYYRLDSINKKLELVKLISEQEIENKIKKQFHYNEKIKIMASTNKYTYIAKDTIKDCQVYYQINTTYVPQKRSNEWVLIPNLSSKFEDVFKMGIYEKNITSLNRWLGNTFALVSIDSLGQNIPRYDIYLKYYTKFSCNTEVYKYCHDDFVKLEIILRDKSEKENIMLETFTNDAFFKDKNFNMFKYKNGDYFIGVLPQTGTEYQESIFRLDTINWRLDRVIQFNKKTDLNFIRYKKNKNSLISGDVLRELSNFLEEYEIVKVKDGYRLLTN